MIIYEYEIPDPEQPIAESERGACGPSGQLIPFVPKKLLPEDVIGKSVTKITTHLGTYGMGGPGFFGLLLSEEWLVIAIWGASNWLVVDNRHVEDYFYDNYDRPKPWIVDEVDDLSAHVVGQRITAIDIERISLRIELSNGKEFVIEEMPDNRPILEGNKQQRIFSETDDLRRAVFLSPTSEIWV